MHNKPTKRLHDPIADLMAASLVAGPGQWEYWCANHSKQIVTLPEDKKGWTPLCSDCGTVLVTETEYYALPIEGDTPKGPDPKPKGKKKLGFTEEARKARRQARQRRIDILRNYREGAIDHETDE